MRCGLLAIRGLLLGAWNGDGGNRDGRRAPAPGIVSFDPRCNGKALLRQPLQVLAGTRPSGEYLVGTIPRQWLNRDHLEEGDLLELSASPSLEGLNVVLTGKVRSI